LVRSILFDIELQIRDGDCERAFYPDYPINPSIACVRGFALKSGGHLIEVDDVVVFIDGVLCNATVFTLPGLTLTNDGPGSQYPSMTISHNSGLIIQYSRFFIHVSVPGDYYGNVTGLCGSWGPGSDMRTRNGTVAADLSEFGSSWQVDQNEGDEILFSFPNPDCDTMTRSVPQKRASFACLNSATLQYASQVCRSLLSPPPPYDQCFKLLDISKFYTACIYDYCQVGGGIPIITEAVVTALKASCKFKVAGFSASTGNPTTASPTTSNPTTAKPKGTTANPTTKAASTTANPTTKAASTTANPTTKASTTANPTTGLPTSANPTTANPTTANPSTTANPTTASPTANPTTASPTTAKATTHSPSQQTTGSETVNVAIPLIVKPLLLLIACLVALL